MKIFQVSDGGLSQAITLPPSKSHTLRALLFALMAKGVTIINNPLDSLDTKAMITAIEAFGAKVEYKDKIIKVTGVGSNLSTPDDIIDCKNSGIVFRFLSAISSLLPTYTIFTGDDSIRHQRTIKPLLDALESLGGFAKSSRLDGHAPIVIKGPLKGKNVRVIGEDSQVVSALLILAPFLEEGLEIEVENPKELPWIDMTLYWLKYLSIPFYKKDYTFYKISAIKTLNCFEFTVPGDLSQAAFLIAAALMTNSTLKLLNIDLTDIQGDKVVIKHLEKMGAFISYDLSQKELVVFPSPILHGIDIDMDECVDALPILAVIATKAKGQTKLYNAAICRVKESNRLESIAGELKLMGALIEVSYDSMIIHESKLHFAKVFSHHDHRIAMALSIAGLSAEGGVFIKSTECIHKTYPRFFEDLKFIGATLCADHL